MIDKPLFIIICMYVLSIGFLGAQFMADSYGITLETPDGSPVRSGVLDFINQDFVNTFSSNATQQVNQTSGLPGGATFFIDNPVVAGATMAWELFLLMTGTYIFNLLYLFGMPPIFIVMITVPYMFLLVNTLIAKIRGV